jgi:predicted metal-dependent hydrolase
MARRFVKSRIAYFNQFYNFKFNKIFIKNQSTRWGSCSSLRNLNFNYKIIYLRPDLADYLIVHELCHLGEMNHSKRFKDLVSKTIPNYVKLNKELKKLHVKTI